MCPNRAPDFALLPYAGAGPYPQTFVFDDEAVMMQAARRKEAQFIAQYARYMEALRPAKAMPFAGKYYLAGKLAPLNRYRGVPDAYVVKEIWGDKAVLLEDGGSATYDLETRAASAERRAAYDEGDVGRFLAGVADVEFAYERELTPDPGREFPILPLLATAKRRAGDKIAIEGTFWLVFRPDGMRQWYALNAGDKAPPKPIPASVD